MCKRMTLLAICMGFCLFLGLGVSAQAQNIYDFAELLTPEQEMTLEQRAAQMESAYPIDVAVVLTNDSGGMDEQEYAEAFYAEMNMGYGEDKSGAVMAVCMDVRGYYMATKGALDATFRGDYDVVWEEAPDYLSGGQYYEAVWAWLERINMQAAAYAVTDQAGYVMLEIPPYTLGNAFGDAAGMLLFYLLGGAVIAGISVFVMWSQCKTGNAPRDAASYIVQGSMNLLVREDTFLRSAVTCTPKSDKSDDKDSDSGNYGGSGGKF